MGDITDMNYSSNTNKPGLNEIPDTNSTGPDWKCYVSFGYCTNGTHITIEEEEDNVAFWQIPQLIFLSVMFLFIVAGNSCLLAAINLSENGRKTRMNFFIMNLAIADLLVGLFHVSADIAEKSVITFHAGPAVCKIVKFMQATVVYASTFVLVSLSIDRVDAIARPMNFARRATATILSKLDD
ncbi:hypothetical protein CHS0354_008825 [Potamilus streckersoni]|uniref:G-protein coupled receptors family 1 profile domain-containing protein n=1 Tax=Potamilus streckersoni TaxID=2493646 RepID=A0AAE0VYJ2_9BIVA|nr:hypothetical protein CHS0354_008825 [Potamilus streckersoni]